MSRCYGWMLVAVAVLAGCAPKCFIKKNETVEFYPTYVYRQPDGHWMMPVMAWVHDTEPAPSLAQGLAKMANIVALFPQLPLDALTLQERVTPFLLAGDPKKTIPIVVEQKSIHLSPSDADGYVRQEVLLPVVSPSSSAHGWLPFQTPACHTDARVFKGQALVIGDKGLSVVADLDALQESGQEHNSGSFMGFMASSFQADPAWTPLYHRWSSEGAVFHYLSPLPWQLFPIVSEALSAQGLPAGTLQLKTLAFRQSFNSVPDALSAVAALFASPAGYQAQAVEALLQRFPSRHFILIGQADEAALYAGFGRKYPQQVAHIWIHDPAGPQPDRYRKVFMEIPSTKWKVFQNPEELPQS